MTTATNASPEIRKSYSTGGPTFSKWCVCYTDASGYRAETCFKRKCDAVAVFDWMLATDWNGVGDFEDKFVAWAIANRHAVAFTFQGEI